MATETTFLLVILPLIDSDILFMVGPHEHHSNLLPWREIGATVINIRANSQGTTDLNHLEQELISQKALGDVLVGQN